jgi:hypothetical protein
MTHVPRHDAKALGLEFAIDRQRVRATHRRARGSVRKAGENEPVAMDIGVHEQHCAADRVESDEVRPAAKRI